MSFFTWFTSLSSFHVWMVGCPFSLLSYTPTHTHIHIKNIKSHTFFIHSFIGIHLSYFHILTIMNSTAMNMRERVSVRYSVISFVYIPRSRIAESYGRSIFNFLKKLHIVFHNDWNHLYFYQYCTNFFSSISLPTLVISSSWWYLVLMDIFLIISDAEYHFMYMLAIWISSLEKCLLSSSASSNQIVDAVVIELYEFFILDINLLSDTCFANFPICKLNFHFVHLLSRSF